MKIVVADTSSLILLSKAQVLTKVCSRHQVFIPASVENEASSPELREKYLDASEIYDLIQRNALKVRKLSGRKKEMPVQLGRGEADAIRLFLRLRAHLLLTDDGKAIKVCRAWKIPFKIAPSIIVDLKGDGDLTFDEAIRAIEKLRIFGRYSPDIIAEVMLKIQKEQNNA